MTNEGGGKPTVEEAVQRAEHGDGLAHDRWCTPPGDAVAQLRVLGNQHGFGRAIADEAVSRLVHHQHTQHICARERLVWLLDWLMRRDTRARARVATLLANLLQHGVATPSLSRCLLDWAVSYGAALPELCAAARFVHDGSSTSDNGMHTQQTQSSVASAATVMDEQRWKVDELECEASLAENAATQARLNASYEQASIPQQHHIDAAEWEDVLNATTANTRWYETEERQKQHLQNAVQHVERRLIPEADRLLALAWRADARHVYERVSATRARLGSLLRRVHSGEGVVSNGEYAIDVALTEHTQKQQGTKGKKRRHHQHQRKSSKRVPLSHNDRVLRELADDASCSNHASEAANGSQCSRKKSASSTRSTGNKGANNSVRAQLMEKLRKKDKPPL